MPEFMPPEFAEWLSTITVLELVAWVGGVLFVYWLIRKGWRRVVAVADSIVNLAGMLAAIHGLPGFMKTTAETLAGQNATLARQDVALTEHGDTQTEQGEQIAQIHHELAWNNESSTKDAVRRVEMGVRAISDRLDKTEIDAAAIRQDLDDTLTPAQTRRLHEVIKE